MIYFFGYFFISLLISGAIVFFSAFSLSNFLDSFLIGNFLSVFATLVGFDMAAVIFFLGQLMIVEGRTSDSCFENTKTELKHNIICMIILFFMSFLLLIFYPSSEQIGGLSGFSLIYFYIIKILIISFFVLAMILIFEILKNIFKLNSKK